PAAALAQSSVDVVQGGQEEGLARLRLVAAAQETFVEAEHRQDDVVRRECRRQCRMVVKAQIATKPEDRRHQPPALTASRRAGSSSGQRKVYPSCSRREGITRWPVTTIAAISP